MICSGFWLRAWLYDDIIIWAHLIQGDKLLMVLWWPIVGETVEMWIRSYESIRISADGIVSTTFWWNMHTGIGSSHPGERTADCFARNNCWWVSEDVNALYRPIQSVPMVLQWPLLNGTVCTQMVRSGNGLGASPYDDIIVWSHLIQGSKLPMESWGLIIGESVKMWMPRMGSLVP